MLTRDANDLLAQLETWYHADIGDMVTPLGASTDARAAVVTMADPTSLLIEADVSETSLPSSKIVRRDFGREFLSSPMVQPPLESDS